MRNDFITSVQSIKCYESENGSDIKEVICKESFCWYQWRDDGNITRGCRERKNKQIRCKNAWGTTDCYCDFDNCNKICNNCTDCEIFSDDCNRTTPGGILTYTCPDNCRSSEEDSNGDTTVSTKSCTSKPEKSNDGTKSPGKTSSGCQRNTLVSQSSFALGLSHLLLMFRVCGLSNSLRPF